MFRGYWLDITLLHGPLHRAAHNRTARYIRASKTEWVNQMEDKIFYNLILEVTAYHFWYILFVKSKPLDFAYIQKEKLT